MLMNKYGLPMIGWKKAVLSLLAALAVYRDLRFLGTVLDRVDRAAEDHHTPE